MHEPPLPVLEPAWQYGRSRPRRTRRLIVMCLLVLAAVLLWALHPIWLTWIAAFLNRSSTPTMSDAIVLLGGGRGHPQDRYRSDSLASTPSPPPSRHRRTGERICSLPLRSGERTGEGGQSTDRLNQSEHEGY